VVKDAKVSVINSQTGALREAASGSDGSVTFAALSLTGRYTVAVSKEGFGSEERNDVTLRAGETATLKVKLLVGTEKTEVTVYGTAEGVRADPQIGRPLDSATIDETPILGRKITTLPLFNSAFRQGKGTGDLFVNATYFITGSGSRRTTTFMLDGASNDEGWGRQTMLTTVPIGAVQEAAVLTNAFSAEFGWTAGPAMNIVTKSGTNSVRGEALYLARPGGMQAKTFGTKGYCAPAVSTCTTPTTLAAINPADLPDELNQVSGSIGGPVMKDKTFAFLTADYTAQNRTTVLSNRLPAFVLPADGSLEYVGRYRQTLFNGRLDHKLSPSQTLMVRGNYDHFYDTNPNDAVVGTNAPTVARRYTRGSRSLGVNDTFVVSSTLLNEVRFAYLDGAPVTLWEAQNPVDGLYPRRIGTVHDRRIACRRYLRPPGAVRRHRLVGARPPQPAVRRQRDPAHDRRQRQRTRPGDARHLHVREHHDRPVHRADARGRPAVLAADQLRHHQLRAVAMDVGGVRAGSVPCERSVHARRRRPLRPADADRRVEERRAAPRLRVASAQRRASRRSRRLCDVLHADSRQRAGQRADRRARRLVTYTATPGQTGFPTCLTGSCLPVQFDPRTLPLAQQPARNITVRAGQRISTGRSSPATDSTSICCRTIPTSS
jgi:hypothetical protein